MCRAVALLCLIPVLALAGCKPDYPLCSKDKHCIGDEERCVDSLCQNCKTDADCVSQTPPGYAPWQCREFRCTEHSGPPKADVGPAPACASVADCSGGMACKSGQCEACVEDGDCSPGGCTEQTGRCSPAGMCSPQHPCPDGESCDGGMCVYAGSGAGGPCETEAVFFAHDSDELTPRAKAALESVAQCIHNRRARVLVEAHTDAAGDVEFNIGLAEGRARTVKAALMRSGVPELRIETIAKGKLEAQGNDAKSRRVQLFFD